MILRFFIRLYLRFLSQEKYDRLAARAPQWIEADRKENAFIATLPVYKSAEVAATIYIAALVTIFMIMAAMNFVAPAQPNIPPWTV